jgi:hypothetical protein
MNYILLTDLRNALLPLLSHALLLIFLIGIMTIRKMGNASGFYYNYVNRRIFVREISMVELEVNVMNALFCLTMFWPKW